MTVFESSNNFSFDKRLIPQEEVLAISTRNQNVVVGIPRETECEESRISLTPLSVEMLVNKGHTILIETNAGKSANFSDIDFSEAGAKIVSNKEEIYQCDVILKIAPINIQEINLLKGNQILISTLNIGTQTKEYFEQLIHKKMVAIAFEYLKDEHNDLPVVRSMSEIVGITAILIAAEYLSNKHEGRGKILGGVTGVNPSEVVILGAGTAGENAARTAIGLGATVKVFDKSIYKLRRLQNNLNQKIFTSVLQSNILENALQTADVVIGAVRMIDDFEQFIISEKIVSKMKKGSVIIDISIDQGGCFETSRITTHHDPVFVKNGVIHYCVPNIASRVSRTASYALSNIFAPLIQKIGETGSLAQLIKTDHGLRSGVYLYKGILTNHQIGNHYGMQSQDINLLLAAF